MTDSTNVVAILTSHNRRAQTIDCLLAFFAQTIDGVALRAVLVDDGSSDGTADAVAAEFARCTVLRGDGTLYWARGMATAEAEALRRTPDYILWLNDDVTLAPTAVSTLINIATDVTATDVSRPLVVSGALVDPVTGDDSYGAMRRIDWHPMRYALVHPNGSIQDADTCNGNVLLVPAGTLRSVGGIDGGFEHGYADFDYGLRVRKAGGRVVLSPAPVGTCRENTSFEARARTAGTIRERLRVLGDVKGRPWRSEVRYLRRHAGLWWPAVFAIPYLKAVGSVRHRTSASGHSKRTVVMLEGTASDYRAPLYRELIDRLDAPFVLGADTASPSIEVAVSTAGGRFVKLPARRRAGVWTHADGFEDTTSVVVFTRSFSFLRRERPSTIVVTEMGLRAAQAALYKLLHPRVRLVIWARLSERSEKGRSLARLQLRRVLARFATAVIVNGPSGARYCEDLGASPTKIVVIPQVSAIPGATATELKNRRRSNGLPTFLYVGQLVPRKGVDLLIKAVAGAALPLHLRIIGSGPQLAELKDLSNTLGTSTDFVDWINDPDELRREYLHADYFVLPSLADEWGLVVVEALSQGTPVVGSIYSEAVASLVVPGLNGFSFAPDDHALLVSALDDATRLSAEDWQHASAAAAHSVETITVATTAERFRAVVAGP
ncbi:MAG TPA: glycosyltransferase [Acidothermaceae bacterium]|jgi:glycosyltransferase involved in cell wall biosynthesis